MMSPPHLGERDPEKWPKNALKGIVQEKFSAILRVLVLSDAGVLSTVLCTIFRVAKRGGRCCIERLLRPPTLRGRPNRFSRTASDLRSEDPRSQDPGSGPIELVFSDAGESVGDLGTIFRVTSRLERRCEDHLLTPPHLRGRDPRSAS